MQSFISPIELIEKLNNSKLFQDWHKEHADSFLSHFFCPLDAEFKSKSNWEIGYYNKNGKITVFVCNNNNNNIDEDSNDITKEKKENNYNFIIKPEDDVFKKETEKVEELQIEKIIITADEAVETFKIKKTELYSNEQIGEGFLVLQSLNEKPLWNFTFITKSIKFLNIKINAVTGEVESHQIVELVQK